MVSSQCLLNRWFMFTTTMTYSRSTTTHVWLISFICSHSAHQTNQYYTHTHRRLSVRTHKTEKQRNGKHYVLAPPIRHFIRYQ